MRRILGIVSVCVLVGCSGSGDANTDSTAAGQDTAASASATAQAQSADAEFLKSMVDHHEGLVVMATAAMTKGSKPATQQDAHMLHTKQAAERDSMIAMLRADYSESKTPTVMEKNRAQNDSLQKLSGAQYDRTFYRLVIDHHREGIAMIDSMSPRLTKDAVRTMAQKMKNDQEKEIADFQKKAGT